ncbi:MAG: NAD(P)/FAD-dependent oxidoreductase [Nitrospiraceae bacterium]|nr:NAD(P)/FAD-dependent oxidoreductase [Nitrospiraceae bacterium]
MVDSGLTTEICIIGGGAAGLAAAIFAAEQPGHPSVHVLDGAKSFGAKILVSGGGRCNVTHASVSADDFFGTRHLVRNVLASFPVSRTVEWFASLGVELKQEETGKLFPVTNKARTVVEALLRRCRQVGVVLRPDHRVRTLTRTSSSGESEMDDLPSFVVGHRHGELLAKRVILATGGRSLPRSGSDGAGYDLARRLGHQVTPISPALVALTLEGTFFHRLLSGSSQETELTTMLGGKVSDRRTGNLLWTHFGVSGPVVMDASRLWTEAHREGRQVQVSANFLPGMNLEQARDWFLAEAAAHPKRSLLKTLACLLPEGLAEAIARRAGCDFQQATAQVPRPAREQLLAWLTRCRLPVTGDRGWNFAEVTAGGIPLEEIDYRTMESKVVPGLHLVGEILDCDGRIGGFNFQWAWATGYLAGRAAGVAVGKT